MALSSRQKGSWITLTEYSYDDNGDASMATIKTEYVDGKRIKEDAWYKLKMENSLRYINLMLNNVIALVVLNIFTTFAIHLRNKTIKM